MEAYRSKLFLLVAVLALGGCSGSEVLRDARDGAGASSDAGPAREVSGDASSLVDAPAATSCETGLPADLCFLREEEKLARDVYVAFFARTGIMVFNNISRSEQTHTDAVAALLAARGIADPVTDDTPGVFRDPVLAGLYEALSTEGAMGDGEALRVGATIEDLDLRDIAQMRTRTTEIDVLALYDSLACGSRNHMRSFSMQLVSRGLTYEPSYISAAELAAILASPRETCAPQAIQ